MEELEHTPTHDNNPDIILAAFRQEVSRIAADKTRAHFEGVDINTDELSAEYATVWHALKSGSMGLKDFVAWRSKQTKRAPQNALDYAITAWLGNVAQAECVRREAQRLSHGGN